MACDQHHVLANQGKLPWNCPEEVIFYKKMIKNQIVIMGYKTYQEMPVSFFENHTAIVFSKKAHAENHPHVTMVSSLDAFYHLKTLPPDKQCYLIGGAEIVTLFLENKAIDHFYLSEIEGYYPGDVFFPMHLMKNYPRTLHRTGSGFSVYHYIGLKESNG
jgi:dihydrofolate reductase